MHAVSTEELLARARLVAAGEGSSLELTSALESATTSTLQSLQRFLTDSEGDASMPQEMRHAISQGMEGFLQALQALQRATVQNDLSALQEALAEAESKVQEVRSAQLAHQASLAQGPTVFPFLNRLLMQYQSALEGGDRQRALELMEGKVAFSQWLRNSMVARAISPVDAQIVYELQTLLDDVEFALRERAELPAIESVFIELSSAIAGLLSEPIVSAEEGPTPVAAVNQVFEALSACTGAGEEVEFLYSVMAQCKNSLRTMVPANSSEQALAALTAVLQALDRIERCLREGTGYDDLVEGSGALEATAIELYQAAGDSRLEPAGFSESTDGLPPFLRSILLPAFAFLDGGADSDTIFSACDHLDQTASNLLKQTSMSDQGDERVADLSHAAEAMREAAEMLRGLASNGDERLLNLALGLLHESSEKLRQAGVG